MKQVIKRNDYEERSSRRTVLFSESQLSSSEKLGSKINVYFGHGRRNRRDAREFIQPANFPDADTALQD